MSLYNPSVFNLNSRPHRSAIFDLRQPYSKKQSGVVDPLAGTSVFARWTSHDLKAYSDGALGGTAYRPLGFKDAGKTDPVAVDGDGVYVLDNPFNPGTYDGSQPNATKRPTCRFTQGDDGIWVPGFELDGVDDFLQGVVPWAASAPTGIVFSFIVDLIADSRYTLFDVGVGNGAYFRFDGDNSGYFGLARTFRLEPYPGPGFMPSSGIHVISVVSTGAFYSVYLDGVNAGMTVANFALTSDAFTLGCSIEQAQFTKGIFYGAVASSDPADMAAMESYLRTLPPAKYPTPTGIGPTHDEGDMEPGGFLTVDHGDWIPGPILEYGYRYLRDGVVISGETSDTYTYLESDEGVELDPQVRARNANGWSSWVSAGNVDVEFPEPDQNTFLTGTGLQSEPGFDQLLFNLPEQFTDHNLFRYHVLTIESGNNLVPGLYTINNLNEYNGHHLLTLAQIAEQPWPFYTGPSNDGVWSIEFGITDGEGERGTNLIELFGYTGVAYDPDSPINYLVIGAVVTITDSNGSNPVNTKVTNTNPNFGGRFLAWFAPLSGEPSLPIGFAGLRWVISVPAPNINRIAAIPDFTASIRMMFIGDSITEQSNTQALDRLTEIFPSASSIISRNRGVGGSKTFDWEPGDANYDNAVAQAVSDGTTIVSIMLGTNDVAAVDFNVTTSISSLQNLLDNLWADIPTLQFILVNDIPSPQGANAEAYNALIPSVGHGATIGSMGVYGWFTEYLEWLPDTVHPDFTGRTYLVEEWLRGLIGPIQDVV